MFVSNDITLEKAHQLAGPTGFDVRTILACLEGRTVRRSTRKAIEAAAQRLGIELPAAPATSTTRAA